MADVIPLRPRRAGPATVPPGVEPSRPGGRPLVPPQYEGLFREPVWPPDEEED